MRLITVKYSNGNWDGLFGSPKLYSLISFKLRHLVNFNVECIFPDEYLGEDLICTLASNTKENLFWLNFLTRKTLLKHIDNIQSRMPQCWIITARMQENSKLLQIIPFVKGFETVFDIIFDTQNSGIFVSRVGLVLKVIGWDEIELICRFEKEFLFLSLQASYLRWHYLLLCRTSVLSSFFFFFCYGWLWVIGISPQWYSSNEFFIKEIHWFCYFYLISHTSLIHPSSKMSVVND